MPAPKRMGTPKTANMAPKRATPAKNTNNVGKDSKSGYGVGPGTASAWSSASRSATR